MMKKFFPILLFFCSVFLWGEDLLPDTLTAQAAVLMDFDTGRFLYEKEGDQPIPPASMAKVMTLYLAYDAIRQGVLDKDLIVTINEVGSSFSRPPRSSLMLLEEGQEVSVLGLMKGLAVASGNDAAYALADLIGPGIDAFVERMNRKAVSLGLKNTVFVDPDGWSEHNMVTAEEYSILARNYIMDYPEALEELHSVPFLVYPLPENMPEDRVFRIQIPRKKRNTNRLLGLYEGIDGLKTGYIDEAGFNFSATAEREGCRLISVIMGVHTDNYYDGILKRAEESALLLDYGFGHYRLQGLQIPPLPEMRVWKGAQKSLQPRITEPASALLADTELSSVYSFVSLEEQIHAPVSSDQIIGVVRYYLGEELLGEIPITAGTDIPEGNLFQRFRDGIALKWMAWRSQS